MAEATVQEPDADPESAPVEPPTRTVAGILRRLPFTSAAAALMILVGLATGSLWYPVTDRSWYDQIAYGLPTLAEGRVWTLVTGPFFALSPVYYLPMVGSFLLFVGWAEWRLGTRRTIVVTVAGHIVGVCGAALLLWLTQPTGWPWALRLGNDLDVGFSAGSFAALAVTASVLRSPWRLRLRLAIGIYLLIAVIYSGNLADLEHLLAGFAGLFAGRWVTRDIAAPSAGRPTRREWRLLAVAGVLVILLGTVMSWLIPSDGPLGSTGDTDSDWIDVLITLVLTLLLVNGLRKGKRWAWWWGVVIGVLNVLLGVLVAVVVIVALVLDEPFEILGGALFVADRLLWLVLLVVLIVGRRAFRTPSKRKLRKKGREAAADRGAAVAALHRVGGGTISWMATWPANSWFGIGSASDAAAPDSTAPAVAAPPAGAEGSADEAATDQDTAVAAEDEAPVCAVPQPAAAVPPTATTTAAENDGAADGGTDVPEIVIAYQAHTGVAIGLGDPICPPGDHDAAVAGFSRMADRAGLIPCMFSVGDSTAAAAAAYGWQHVQVAEDTLIDLPGLSFTGKSWQNVRSAINRAKKEGIEFRMVTLADEPWSLVERVRGMTEEWVGDKGLPEMGFTLGGVDEALDREVRVGIAQDASGTLHGVTSWLPVYGPGGVVRGRTLDLMLRRHDGFRPVVEFLIAQSCLSFREDGADVVSLSGAPLARAEGEDEPITGLQRVLDQIGAVLEPLYGFRSLHAFKAKFQPRYEAMHLVYRDEADLARIGMAITRAYLPDTPMHELVKLTRS